MWNPIFGGLDEYVIPGQEDEKPDHNISDEAIRDGISTLRKTLVWIAIVGLLLLLLSTTSGCATLNGASGKEICDIVNRSR
jgi:hypothetical protein